MRKKKTHPPLLVARWKRLLQTKFWLPFADKAAKATLGDEASAFAWGQTFHTQADEVVKAQSSSSCVRYRPIHAGPNRYFKPWFILSLFMYDVYLYVYLHIYVYTYIHIYIPYMHIIYKYICIFFSHMESERKDNIVYTV